MTLVWLAGVWLLWSGRYSEKPLILSLGVLSCLFVAFLWRRMERATKLQEPILEAGLATVARLIAFLPWLAWQIIVSNLKVARLILDPTLKLRPRLVAARVSQRSAFAQVVHANSITMTPGTLTLDLRHGELLVHALNDELAAPIEDGTLDRRVSRLEASR